MVVSEFGVSIRFWHHVRFSREGRGGEEHDAQEEFFRNFSGVTKKKTTSLLPAAGAPMPCRFPSIDVPAPPSTFDVAVWLGLAGVYAESGENTS